MKELTEKLRSRLGFLDPRGNSEWGDVIALRNRVQADFTKDGCLSWQVFDMVLHWKLRSQRGRTEHHRIGLTPEIVRNTTNTFFTCAHRDERVQREMKLKTLQALQGIGIGVSTAILTLAHPREYGIIDYRVWRVLYKRDRRYFTLGDYHRYLQDIRQLATFLKREAQEVDYLLWKEYEALPANQAL